MRLSKQEKRKRDMNDFERGWRHFMQIGYHVEDMRETLDRLTPRQKAAVSVLADYGACDMQVGRAKQLAKKGVIFMEHETDGTVAAYPLCNLTAPVRAILGVK